LYVPRKQGQRGPYAVRRSLLSKYYKLVEYVDRKKDPLIQIARTHKHNITSARLQTASCLKTAVQRGTRQMKESIAEKTKEIW
jgi:hypothetical protein